MTHLQVRLFRDSFSTPWGFRLQGGKDIGQPLSIQRVFSNSPAEGELQRGDLVLSIGGQSGRDLTHQQAQDIAKRGAPHIDLVVQRPVPSRVSSTTTFTPAVHKPRAQSVQLSPVSIMPVARGPGLRLNANPCYNPQFRHQYSPSSPHPPPPWTQQNFAPQKVSKLSELGGGSPDFGVDYGSHYGTVPRRRHSTQAFSYTQQSQYAGGSPYYADHSFPFLGGRNFDYGTDYCTLPRKHRQTSQPPAPWQPSSSTMPVSSRGGSGFSPKKVTLTRLGGGGPEFGSDFTRSRPSAGYSQPVHVHTGMMNRVHDSLDNLSLSPRTPDYGYQAPQFAASSSPGGGGGGGGQYIPTGVRLDMEREQELRQQQQQQQQQQQLQDFQPAPAPQQQYYFEPQQQPYVATGIRLDHQMGESEDQTDMQQSVSERRKTFLNAPARHVPAPTGKSSAPKVLRPKPGNAGFNFGVDYTKPQPKTSSVTWKPQSAQRPVNVPPPPSEMVQSAPSMWSQQQDEVDQPQMPPAWRTTLKTTGVKPWDKDLEYSAGQQMAPPPQTSSAQVPNPDKAGDRDWTQSAVYRMIYEEEHRGRPGPQHQQQQKPSPPVPAPKPQTQTFQQAFNPLDNEYGTSDF